MATLLEKPVSASIGTELYKVQITWRNGTIIADEPVHLGGKDLGPDPYTLLLSALASCTLSTLRMYIDRKAWQIGTINIEVNLSQAIVEGKIVSTFYRNIIFGDPITEDQNERLLSIARKCPVSKILENGIAIETQTKFLN